MPRDYEVYLEDIRDAIGKVKRYTTGLTREAFETDDKTVDAVVRNLEIIGEAVKMIPESIRLAHANIEWKKIAGLRDSQRWATLGLSRSAATRYWIKSFEPIEMKSVSRRIASIQTAAAGTSTMTPVFTSSPKATRPPLDPGDLRFSADCERLPNRSRRSWR